MEWLKRIHASTPQPNHPSFRAGDQVRVWHRIQERERVRTASFEGTVLRVRGSGSSRTVTVRRVTFGEGVERIFHLSSPLINRIEVVRRGDARRSRLYFLRTIVGKSRIVSTEVMPESGRSGTAAGQATADTPSAETPGVDEPSVEVPSADADPGAPAAAGQTSSGEKPAA